MNTSLSSLIKLPDFLFARFYLRLFHEKNSLMIFNFHILFQNEEEINLNLVDPQLGITVDYFQQFIEYYLNHSYSFISPNDILYGLDTTQNYIMITFDDGYFNNTYALPFLKKYQIPVVFFITTSNIRDNRCFWWDVLYREEIKSSNSARKIRRKQDQLKTKTTQEIENHLRGRFGEDAFHPVGDIDRPLTLAELKEISKEKNVFIGNHTTNHAILTNYPVEEMKSQIVSAQDFLFRHTRTSPVIISYPGGFYSDEIIKISKEIGLKLGLTTKFKKNYLPIDCQNDNLMHLTRFDLGGESDPLKICEIFRSDIIVYKGIWNFLNKGYLK
jgi:peptidoglycan/xylan/chitin deacetylase (PgdA/CDA1 family)